VKTQYHRAITKKALDKYFSVSALEDIVSANLGQDALRYQFGHDHFHYDSNSFVAGDAYCYDLRRMIVVALQAEDVLAARGAFGRLTHTVQDFYAHSNYVSLWRDIYPDAAPAEIEPELTLVLSHPRLHSGKLYYPLEIFAFIDALKAYILPLLPRDSHAWMNIDDPSRPNFEYAFSAAVKKTSLEYQRLIATISMREVILLTGLENKPQGDTL